VPLTSRSRWCSSRGALAAGLVVSVLGSVVACRDYAGPIPDTDQTTASNEPSEAPASENDSTSAPTPNAPPADDGMPDEPDLVSFDNDVHPILVAKCGMCHEGAAPVLPDHGASDVDIAFAATQGQSTVNDEPVYQRILARASGEDEAGFMPPGYAGCEGPLGTGDCLTEEEFDTIELWVEQGANNR
jgi:hypothetical protein